MLAGIHKSETQGVGCPDIIQDASAKSQKTLGYQGFLAFLFSTVRYNNYFCLGGEENAVSSPSGGPVLGGWESPGPGGD